VPGAAQERLGLLREVVDADVGEGGQDSPVSTRLSVSSPE